MKNFKTFIFENTTKIGTYVSCNYDDITNKNIATWCVKNSILDSIPPEKYHTTILYSRNKVDITPEINDLFYFTSSKINVVGFELFDSKEDSNLCALVLKLESQYLSMLHDKLISIGGTHDYDSFTPHITISYKIHKNFDTNKLILPDFNFIIKEFKVEPLDLDWTA